jgi:uncharacterized protein (TIGR00369 family)
VTDPRLLALIDSDSIAYWRTLGIHVVDAEVGRARLGLAMHEGLSTFRRPDLMHGGAISSLIDAAAATATRTLQKEGEPPWRGLASTDLNVSYLDGATSDITAEARVLRSGRAIAFVEVEVRDARETLVAVGRVTLVIRRGD